MWCVTYLDDSTEEFENIALELVYVYNDDKKSIVKIVRISINLIN